MSQLAAKNALDTINAAIQDVRSSLDNMNDNSSQDTGNSSGQSHPVSPDGSLVSSDSSDAEFYRRLRSMVPLSFFLFFLPLLI